MKTILFFILSLGLSLGLQAQGNLNRNAKISPRKTDRGDFIAPNQNKPIVSRGSKEGNYVGKAGNIYSFISEYQSCLNYDSYSGLIQMIHRADPATYPEADDNSTIISSQSIDDGEFWDYKALVLYEEDRETRYPQGFIYNIDENEDPSDVIIGSTGPVHDNNAWTQNYFASALNDSYLNGDTVQVMDMHISGSNSWEKMDAVRYGTDVCDDGSVYALGGFRHKEEEEWTNFDLDVYRGENVENYIDFGEDRHSTVDALAYTARWWGEATMAWSQDGSIGYLFGCGLINEFVNQSAYNPVVWKSTDSGETWQLLVEGMNMVDFPGIEDVVLESNDGHRIPLFKGGVTGVVDNNGDLQFFGECYSGSTLNVEECHISLEEDEGYRLLNVTVNPNEGITNFHFITNFMSYDVSDDSEYAYASGADGVGWTHRLQASRTINANYYCVVYGDTENAEALYGGENAKPDLFLAANYGWGWGYLYQMTFDGCNWFHYSSKIGRIDNYSLNIPAIVPVTFEEMLMNTDIDPVTIEYRGVTIQPGISQNASSEIELSVSPNPVRSTVRIALKNSNQEYSQLTFEISELSGKIIFQQTVKNSQTAINLNVESWVNGIYFILVRNHDKIIGQAKLIVQHSN